MTDNQPDKKAEQRKARNLIKRIIALGHRRLAGSDTERRTHELLDKEFQKQGLQTELIPFWTNQNLYQTMALHFGIGFGGTLLVIYGHPFLGMLCHFLAGLSYLWDSNKTRFVLRKLLPKAASQNLIARQPADNPNLRIVLMAHADAAFTGKMFEPDFVKRSKPGSYPPGFAFMSKGLRVVTISLLVLAVLDFWILVTGMGWFKWLLLIGLSIPTTIAFALNSEVVYRNQMVPGASDNLSGCAALLALAERLQDLDKEQVEINYVVTGAEEAGLTGAVALRRKMQHRWPRTNTIIIAVDTLVGGNLVMLNDGEVVPIDLAQWLVNIATEAAAQTEGISTIERFDIPSGGTDAAPFLYDNYPGLGVGVVDPELGAPRNYHLVDDSLDNFDFGEYSLAIDFLENFTRQMVKQRLGKS